MLGRDKLILEVLGFFERSFEHLIQSRRNIHSRLLASDFGDGRQLLFRLGEERVRLNSALLEHRPHDAFALAPERDQQMQRMHRLMPVLAGEFLRLLDGLLCFLGEFVKSEWHFIYPSYLRLGGRDFHAASPACFVDTTVSLPSVTLTLTWRGFADSFRGSVTVRTPFL